MTETCGGVTAVTSTVTDVMGRELSTLLSADGSAAATYEYDDFGGTTVTRGADFDNENCYTGQIYDRSSGL